MRHIACTAALFALLLCGVGAQQTALTKAHLDSAAIEVPRLVELLQLKPGATVADVGAGFGAWSIAFAKSLGPTGRVYATDIGAAQVKALKEFAEREKLTNVTVIEGGPQSTNLPAQCCDGILVRDAYHHFSDPPAMLKSLSAALRPGGRLAIIDFPPRGNSETPVGVPGNRGGHGIPPEVVEKEAGEVFEHLQTIRDWSPKSQPASLFLVLLRKR